MSMLFSTSRSKIHILKTKMARALVVLIPLVWYIVFLGLPLLVILKISFSEPRVASPPYEPLVNMVGYSLHLTLNFSHYITLIESSAFLSAFINSISLAARTTILCILIGYPITYVIVKSSKRWQNFLFFLVILPYWTSFLLRAYAWSQILQKNGVINQFLTWTGIIGQPLHLMYNDFSVSIGLLYGYLPFFILPLYATLGKLDQNIVLAAYDLGARPFKAFLKITLPLSAPGLLAGSLLVFIPATGEVVIPQLLGGMNNMMVGNIIWESFFKGNNWCLTAALSVILLAVLLFPIMLLQKFQRSLEKTS
jgi:putrescine transport system permease protein